MRRIYLFLSVASCLNLFTKANDFKGFDDNILFSLQFPGTDNLLVRINLLNKKTTSTVQEPNFYL